MLQKSILFLIVNLCLFFILPSFSFAQDNKLPTLAAPEIKVSIPGLQPLQNIQCEEGSCSIPWIGQYIAGLQNYAIGIVGIIAVIVMMIGGIVWLTSGGNHHRIEEAKKLIGGSLVGILLVLSSYLILYIVNPKLTIFNSLQIASIPRVDLEEILPATYQEITGSEPMESFGPEMMRLIEKVAKENNLDPCFLYTFVVKESEGRVNVIGHDENVKSNKVRSHVAYIKSGETYKGISFSDFKKNDDTPVCSNKEDLCLDWRFSHGIGLVQITIFPGDNIKKNGTYAKRIKNTIYTPRELFLPETSLKAAVDYLEESGCGQNLKLCFQKYNGNGPLADQYAAEAVGIYNTCKQNGLPS